LIEQRVADPDRRRGRADLGGGHRRNACQTDPGLRPAGTGTSSSSRSAGTRMNRAVWYLARRALRPGACSPVSHNRHL
jgi:hypothetical protein